MKTRPLKANDDLGVTMRPGPKHPSRAAVEKGKLLARCKDFCWIQWQHDLEPRTEREENVVVDVSSTVYG